MRLKLGIIGLLSILIVSSSYLIAQGRVSQQKEGIIEAIKLFKDLREFIKNNLIEPAEHDQALRYLRRLSYRLDVLALEKDNFARELKTTKWPNNQRGLFDQAQEIRAAVERVRISLIDVFASMPDSFRTAASGVERKLTVDLNNKLESLDNVVIFLGMTSSSQQVDLVQEIQKDAKLTRELKNEVDTLIEQLDSKQ